MKYGVVFADNYNRENKSERWVVVYLDKEDAEAIVNILLQDKHYPNSVYNPTFYKVEPMDYNLYIWEP